MSISKLKRDIELLEKQLNEIKTNISDPIERIEQKKQLERKIKKLKHSKTQIEQLEKEQQELESWKSELSLNSNKSVDQKESEPDKPAERTPSMIDNSIATESETNISEQIEDDLNSQVDNTDSWKKNSDTIRSK